MIRVHRDFDLTRFTSFGVPARCAAFVEWDSVDDLRDAIADDSLPHPLKAIGGGSNLLFVDTFKGSILFRRGATGAARTLDSLCEEMCTKGIWGFENLSGIPGTVGGATVQNAGAYGVEMCDLVDKVTLFSLTDGSVHEMSNDDMRFSYRHSRLKDPDMAGKFVITDVSFNMQAQRSPILDHGSLRDRIMPDEDLSPLSVRKAVIAMRDSKLPAPSSIGSAGSFFRNPELSPEDFRAFISANPSAPHYSMPDGRVKVPAAWLIDRCGLKGATTGGAAVWHSQPLVLVNISGDASANDVVNLEKMVCTEVNKRFGITLIPEVEHIY